MLKDLHFQGAMQENYLTACQHWQQQGAIQSLFQHQDPSRSNHHIDRDSTNEQRKTKSLPRHLQELGKEEWQSVIADTSRWSNQKHNQTENLHRD